jgi:hypothetical protein
MEKDIEYGDFMGEFSQTYSEKCKKCGKIILVSTQKDKSPEYYTDIFIKCDCGESIKFILPVN